MSLLLDSSHFLLPVPLTPYFPPRSQRATRVYLQDLKIDLAGLQERLRAAQGLKGELDTTTENYNGIRKEIENIDARNKELSESLEKLRAVADEVCFFLLLFAITQADEVQYVCWNI